MFKTILDLFINIFRKDLTPEQFKARKLRDLRIELSKSGSKFFNVSRVEALPALAQLLYSFYKIFYPMRGIVKRYADSTLLLDIIIEKSVDIEQKKSLDFIHNFSFDNLGSGSTKELGRELERNMDYLFKTLKADQALMVDNVYNALLKVFDLISYNYYDFLKKFDSLLPEGDFSYKPIFHTIGCGIILDDLKDFLECITGIDKVSDFSSVYDIILELAGWSYDNAPLKQNQWERIIYTIVQLNEVNLFSNAVIYISNDLDYVTLSSSSYRKGIMKAYLNNLSKKVLSEFEKFKIVDKNKKSRFIAQELFNGTEILKLENYNEKAHNKIISKIPLSTGYIYYDLMAYLKTYITYFIKKDLNEFINLLIIKGNWKQNEIPKSFSNIMQDLMDNSSKLNEFDDSLAEKQSYGSRITALLHRSFVGDKASERLFINLMKELNKKANAIILDYYEKNLTLRQKLSECLSDYSKDISQRELLYNWKDLDHSIMTSYGSSNNFSIINQRIIKNIDLFLNLVDLYLGKKS